MPGPLGGFVGKEEWDNAPKSGRVKLRDIYSQRFDAVMRVKCISWECSDLYNQAVVGFLTF